MLPNQCFVSTQSSYPNKNQKGVYAGIEGSLCGVLIKIKVHIRKVRGMSAEKVTIAIIGDSNSGKTSLMYQYINQVFIPCVNTTLMPESKNVYLNGKNIEVIIRDTAGQERFRTVTAGFYRGAHAFFLVYDVTNKESYNNIESWVNEIEKYTGGTNSIKMLIGNKIDLINQRVVTPIEGKQKADSMEISFCETTATEFPQVEHIFNQLISQVIDSRRNESNTNEDGTIIKLGITVSGVSNHSSEKSCKC